MAEKPVYTHHCDNKQCKFLGNALANPLQEGDAKIVDLYAHKSTTHLILIRRYGSEPEQTIVRSIHNDDLKDHHYNSGFEIIIKRYLEHKEKQDANNSRNRTIR